MELLLSKGVGMESKCETCNGTGQMCKCVRCGAEFRHIHKYSDCGSIGCDGERSTDVKCRTCNGVGKVYEYQI